MAESETTEREAVTIQTVEQEVQVAEESLFPQRQLRVQRKDTPEFHLRFLCPICGDEVGFNLVHCN